jgi:uncharacterized protein
VDVILHLTQDCQLNCIYCYGGRKRAQGMSWEVAKLGIDLLFEKPHRNGFPPLLSFFGGEPLLEIPLLKKCVAYAEQHSAETGAKFRMTVTTNGLCADEATIAYIAEKGMATALSFDGVPEAQNSTRPYRGGRESFEDTLSALRRMRHQLPELIICAVVTPENVACLPDSIDLFLENGCRQIVLNPDFFACWTERDCELWRSGYEHAASRFIESFRSGKPLHISFITAKIATHLKGGYGLDDFCDFGTREIAIAPSGNIYPCQRMVGEDDGAVGLMGDVFQGLNPKMCRHLNKSKQIKNLECLDCELQPRCRNWCSCVNQRLTECYDHTAPIVCFHERMAIEIADRTASQLYKENNLTFMRTFYACGRIESEWV